MRPHRKRGSSREPPMKTSARKSLSRPADLISAGLISAQRMDEIGRVAQRYAVALTIDLAELIDRDDPRDPIARQFVPVSGELDTEPQESADPIGDEAHSPVAGVVHRYPDGVLLMPTHLCAVYCRFCCRREVVGGQRSLNRAELASAIAYIRDHQEAWEVILSGGDPFVLSSRLLT